jgi:nucleoside-diphosphate-sugar epimerase
MGSQVSILGCGWLGFPLAKQLMDVGYPIKGSTTSTSKVHKLKSAGIDTYVIELKEQEIIGDVEGFLSGSHLLIINIPPGLRKQPQSDFLSKLKLILEQVQQSTIQRLLYVSSTGVFSDEETIPIYTEDYEFTTEEIEASQLVQAEHLLKNLKHIQTTILRFSGLVGKDRHPVKYLSGKTNLRNPKAPVNLIHLENCIQLISKIITKEKYGYVFHGNEDINLSKEKYYTQKSKEFDLKAPQFGDKLPSKGKKISMEWTTKELGIKILKSL